MTEHTPRRDVHHCRCGCTDSQSGHRFFVGAARYLGDAMKVLVAVDSSPGSQQVVAEIATRPWPKDTAFRVAHVVDAQQFGRFPVPLGYTKQVADEIVRASATTLSDAGLHAEQRVLVGPLRKTLPAEAAQWGVDFIFTGSHGRTNIGRFLLGSVAQEILRTAACSVEIVRPTADGKARSSRPMKILVAVDGSECSSAAARSVAGRPWPKGTVFRIESVEELVNLENPIQAQSLAAIYPESLLEELLTEARTRAVNAEETTIKILAEAGVPAPERHPISVGDPRSVILDTAEQWGADLIVLGSHGRRGIDRWLLGSVSESVAVHAHCSVEVIRG